MQKIKSITNFKHLADRAKAYQEILKTVLLLMTVLGAIVGFLYNNDKTQTQETAVGEEFVFMANEIQFLKAKIDSLEIKLKDK